MRPEHRPPLPLNAFATWLLDLPTNNGTLPPLPGPVREYHVRTVTGKTSGEETQVVEWLYASIGPAHLGRGTRTNSPVRKWITEEVGLPRDDAGHIIGNNLGGLGTVRWNLFPQSRNFNRGVFSQHEQMVYNAASVNGGGNVRIWFRFIYDDAANPGRPSKFWYFIRFPNGTEINNDLINPRA